MFGGNLRIYWLGNQGCHISEPNTGTRKPEETSKQGCLLCEPETPGLTLYNSGLNNDKNR